MKKNDVACLTSYTKFNSKLNKGLNVKANFINILEENIGTTLCELGFGNDFKSTSTIMKYKLNFKITIICASKDAFKKVRTTHRIRANISKLYI